MATVTIELPNRGPEGTSALFPLASGRSATFGRGAPDAPVDIELPFAGVSRLAGRITAVRDFWTVSNLGRHSAFVIENLEGAGEHLKVAPGRLDAPVAFEMSRMILPARGEPCELKIYAPEHRFVPADTPVGALGEPTDTLYSLDPAAKYFRVLVALCEHRLRDPGSVQIPTTAQVITRLGALPEYRGLTPSAVNFHIEYLTGTKLRIRDSARQSPDGRGRLHRRKDALVSFALRFGLVREEHLALLPAPRPGAGPGAGHSSAAAG
ncbi:serine/threonine protein kinase [Streptomyces sp. NPDC049837]|uniref:serine/threonine protein kinase n=1 Tax=Streptomyces sp. NPDC049837 TaxID=3155277 RepID=UPI00343E54AE